MRPASNTTLILLSFFLPLLAFSNAAQPGFWGAGGTGNFSLLYPEDSTSYQKIQMVKELVSIQLYRGYAVVKGQYWMYNETEEAVNIKVGYPLNTQYEGSSYSAYLAEIQFDSLYALKAYSNDAPVVLKTEIPSENAPYEWEDDVWYTWENDFPAKDTTKITVYFIVNTNNNYIRRGYNKGKNNGFIYLLESGATWKQPIVEGEVRIQINDDFDFKDIRGLYPDSIFLANQASKTFFTEFKNLSPTPKDNIILAYTETIDNFDFKAILSNQAKLYSSIDDFSNKKLNKREFSSKEFGNPFHVPTSAFDFGIGLLFFLTVFGIPLLILIASLIALYFLWRWWKKR